LFLLFLTVPCGARTITVDDDGPADFDNIQAAIDDANDGDTVVVQPGAYTDDGIINFLDFADWCFSSNNSRKVPGRDFFSCRLLRKSPKTPKKPQFRPHMSFWPKICKELAFFP
jgi:hypothetical protein